MPSRRTLLTAMIAFLSWPFGRVAHAFTAGLPPDDGKIPTSAPIRPDTNWMIKTLRIDETWIMEHLDRIKQLFPGISVGALNCGNGNCPRDPSEPGFRLHLLSHLNHYSIVFNPPTYLGCTVTDRLSLPDEDWLRDRGLANGPPTVDTWLAIVEDILGTEVASRPDMTTSEATSSLYRTRWLLAHNRLHGTCHKGDSLSQDDAESEWGEYLKELGTSEQVASRPA